jgi:hypothetical protein
MTSEPTERESGLELAMCTCGLEHVVDVLRYAHHTPSCPLYRMNPIDPDLSEDQVALLQNLGL